MIHICSLFSGSSGNCIYIGNDDSAILVDAGVSALRITKELKKIGTDISKIKGVVLTHEHSDHIKGALVLCRRNNIPIYGNQATLEGAGLSSSLPKLCRQFKTGSEFEIDGIGITSFSVPHDTPDPVGYRFYFEKDGKQAAIATDIGHISESVLNGILGADFALVESNHDINMLKAGAYPYFLKRRILSKTGHLCNDDCAKLCVKLVEKGAKNIVLGHLSKENNLPSIAMLTTLQRLKEEGIEVGKEVALEVAMRDCASKIFNF
jgi:phosphoribosyl 1,2-cyclic phosphodiesterase